MKTFDELLAFIKGQRAEMHKINKKITNLARRHGLKCKNCDFYILIKEADPPFFCCMGKDREKLWPECFWPNDEWREKHE